MTCIHFVTHSIFPAPGGLQLALLRLAKLLRASSEYQVAIYTTRQQPAYVNPAIEHEDVEICHLARRKQHLMAPRGEDDGGTTSILNEFVLHSYQVEVLLLEQEIAERVVKSPNARHVIVSFFATKPGFVAQHVALALGLPHIASFRGSDFARDFASPFHIQAADFVVEHAQAVVTTNRRQARLIGAAYPQANKLRTIYNSLEWPGEIPTLDPPAPDTIRLFSDCEFSIKKATHLLIEATAILRDEGLPVTLEIVGRSSNQEDEYWESLTSSFSQRYPGAFSFPGRVSADEVLQKLQTCHIYCSPTLSEGCSHSRIRALVMGLPIVTTRCGALAEFTGDRSHINYARPGDLDDYLDHLRTMVRSVQSGSIVVDQEIVEAARTHFCPGRERREWESVIESVLTDEQ